MFKKLAERSGTSVSVLNETQSPQAKVEVKLEWEDPVWTSAHHATGYTLSRCGFWSVSKVKVGERTHYEACKRATKMLPQPELLGICETPEAAKAMCEARANA